MRYFLAKRHEGPALYVADRIDSLREALAADGLAGQFHPSYTRMVPAHYVVDLALVGCPDPDPIYTRFFDPPRGTLPPDLDEIGRRYIGALAAEIAKWLTQLDAASEVRPTPDGSSQPIGVAFSGRHRQRLRVPGDLPHHAPPRHVALAPQGVRAERR